MMYDFRIGCLRCEEAKDWVKEVKELRGHCRGQSIPMDVQVHPHKDREAGMKSLVSDRHGMSRALADGSSVMMCFKRACGFEWGSLWQSLKVEMRNQKAASFFQTTSCEKLASTTNKSCRKTLRPSGFPLE